MTAHGMSVMFQKGGAIVAYQCVCGQKFSDRHELESHIGDEELMEEQMIEQNDFMASDALRMAVDLHDQKYRYEDITDGKVLETAEAFYQWLKAKQERADKPVEQSKEQYERYREMEPDRPDSTMYPIKREQQ